MRLRFSIYSLLWLTLFAALASVYYANYLWEANFTDVVVSSRALPHGHKITSEDIHVARVPIDKKPEGTATSVSEVLGNNIRNRYTKNHPIYLENLCEIRETASYNWHDNSRINLEKVLGTWLGRTPDAGNGVSINLRYSTFHVGSFDLHGSIEIYIQLPDQLNVGDKHDIKIVSNERDPTDVNSETGWETTPLGDYEMVVSRWTFANPMGVAHNLEDGETAGTIKILEIGDSYAKIELVVEPQLRYVGHGQYGLPSEIKLVRTAK